MVYGLMKVDLMMQLAFNKLIVDLFIYLFAHLTQGNSG